MAAGSLVVGFGVPAAWCVGLAACFVTAQDGCSGLLRRSPRRTRSCSRYQTQLLAFLYGSDY